MISELRLMLAAPWRDPNLRAVYWWAWGAGCATGVTATVCAVWLWSLTW